MTDTEERRPDQPEPAPEPDDEPSHEGPAGPAEPEIGPREEAQRSSLPSRGAVPHLPADVTVNAP
jgi:hypothetical protein